MIQNKFIKFLFFTTLTFFSSGILVYAGSDGLDVNLHIGSCNNNGICEIGEEDFFSCPLDCTPVVVPPESDGGHSSGFIPGTPVMDNAFNNLRIEVSYTSAIIKWNSVIPTTSNVKWGTSPDYRDGVIRNINFLLNHKVELTGLKEGTVYYFSIEAENLLGKTNTLENQVFRTLSLQDITPPGNVTKLEATSTDAGIIVSWDNPKDLDFDYVRVMRNDDRYYGSPFLGYLVYEGRGTYFNDSEVVAGRRYYYSVFSRDRAGNYSSGAMINIVHNPKGLDTWGDVLVPGEGEILPLTDKYIVVQGGVEYDFKIGSIFKLSGDGPIIIKTNYIPKHKNDDMWVEIRSKERGIESQYFFTRVKNKDGYLNVNIPSFDEAFDYTVTIYRYSSSIVNSPVLTINRGVFEIHKMRENIGREYLWYILIFILLMIVLLIILYLIYRYFKRRYKVFK